MHKIYKKMSLDTVDKGLQLNLTKRGRTPLFEYPFEQMSVNDSVTYPKNVTNSYSTIRRAACRYGENLGREFITRILSDGCLGIQRVA